MPSLSTKVPFAYKCIHMLVNWFFNTFYDYSESGNYHIPLKGSAIIASNHVSFYDPPVVGGNARRQFYYFARDTLFKGLLGRIISSIGTIPVNRDTADIKSLKAIFKVLKNGGAIMIFPEGTRSLDGKLSAPKPGAGMIACKSKAKVVPARIFGTFEVWGRHSKLPHLGGSIHISFGPPIEVSTIDPGPDHPDRYGEASRQIMSAIAKLKRPKPAVV